MKDEKVKELLEALEGPANRQVSPIDKILDAVSHSVAKRVIKDAGKFQKIQAIIKDESLRKDDILQQIVDTVG